MVQKSIYETPVVQIEVLHTEATILSASGNGNETPSDGSISGWY